MDETALMNAVYFAILLAIVLILYLLVRLVLLERRLKSIDSHLDILEKRPPRKG